MDINDFSDGFNAEVRRIAQGLSLGKDPAEVTSDYLMWKAAEVYLRHVHDEIDSEDASA